MIDDCDLFNDRFVYEIKYLITKLLSMFHVYELEITNHIYTLYKRFSLLLSYKIYFVKKRNSVSSRGSLLNKVQAEATSA